jgi:hypothetical protein
LSGAKGRCFAAQISSKTKSEDHALDLTTQLQESRFHRTLCQSGISAVFGGFGSFCVGFGAFLAGFDGFWWGLAGFGGFGWVFGGFLAGKMY